MTTDKLEGGIHIPSGGWSLSVTDGTGTASVNVPGVGYCFLSSAGELTDGLLAQLASQLNATMTDNFTVSMSSDTGRVTIENTDANPTSITWTDTELRDVLGFTGDVSGAALYLSPSQSAGIWMPDSPFQTESNGGADAGWVVSDFAASVAPNGSVNALYSNRYRENALSWNAVCRERAWTSSQTIANEAFETFLSNFIWGESAFGKPGGPIAWHPVKTSASQFTYRSTAPKDYKPARPVPKLIGLWNIELPGLIQVPS